MSRSFKHTPRCGDKKNKFMKRCASKRIRRDNLNIEFNNKSYKKFFNSWDICDFEDVGVSFDEFCIGFMRWHDRFEELPSREELWQMYQKYYLRK